mmetsp:Transcript_36215/g.108515  ORF Transcript_36215/g.108515 Transcript_36215/m.108515 type:complete len:102 (+) Transcript_36215:1123-1428(+)
MTLKSIGGVTEANAMMKKWRLNVLAFIMAVNCDDENEESAIWSVSRGSMLWEEEGICSARWRGPALLYSSHCDLSGEQRRRWKSREHANKAKSSAKAKARV